MAVVASLPPLEAPGVLRNYLLERDSGMPSNLPSPALLIPSLILGGSVHLIRWDYVQAVPPRGRPADGFLVFWSFSDTSDPGESCLKTSSDQRTFTLVVPTGSVASYAVAAYRTTHRGEERTAKVAPAMWRAVAG